MRVPVLDDLHEAWDGNDGVRLLRERADARVFAAPFGDPAAPRGFDALITLDGA